MKKSSSGCTSTIVGNAIEFEIDNKGVGFVEVVAASYNLILVGSVGLVLKMI